MKNSNWITGKGKIFKKDFKTKQNIISATLYITAKGLYEAHLNGEKVGDAVLTPGFTSYNKRHLYQEYDVTNMLKENNELIVYVGDGWYKGRLTWDNHVNIYGCLLGIIAKLVIKYENSEEVIYTDESWQCANSPIAFDSIYDGESYGARVNLMFQNVVILDEDKNCLIPQDGEFIKEHERISPVEYITTPKGEKVIDFGQNITGYVEISVNANSFEKIVISHSEILDSNGNFYTDNLRSANQILRYMCKDGFQTYKPRFTFMGFRYIRLDECPEGVEFTAIVVHSDIKRTGHFECSDKLVNKLFENTIWGQKGNFLDIPTDCPQRDERLGWTGDAQIFMKAATLNFNVNKFFEKWLKDLAADQLEDGNVPLVIPDVLKENAGSAAWGDASVICPWQLYLTYGNKAVLDAQFESMEKWIKFSRSKGRYHCGDWLALDASEGSYKGATDDEYIRTAYNAYSTGILMKIGKILGKDVTEYEKLYKEITEEFKTFIPKTQTEYILALHFGLANDKKDEYAKKLADMVVKNGNKLQTGFVGTPYLLHALSDNGYEELAYSLLLQTEYPSWLYPITMGATTIWEHWDGVKPDGSFWSRDMNSYNHYAYGAVVDWMYEVMAGIKIDEDAPAFNNIIFRPVTDKRISYVKASIETKNGAVKSHWRRNGSEVTFSFDVPKNSTATLILDGQTHNIGSGNHIFTLSE